MSEELIAKAKDGEPDAQFLIGTSLLSGTDEQISEGIEWIKKAAQQHYGPAASKLSELYLFGRNIAKDNAEAVRLALDAADDGDPHVQWEAGWLAYRGENVERNLPNAARLLLYSVLNRDLASQATVLGFLTPNLGNAKLLISWILVVSNDEARAACMALVGMMFKHGIAVQQDAVVALGFLENMIDLADLSTATVAPQLLERAIKDGCEVLLKTDRARAITFLERAGNSGSPSATLQLGLLHRKSADLNEAAKAVQWLASAASLGSVAGMYLHGMNEIKAGRNEQGEEWMGRALDAGLSGYVGVECSLNRALSLKLRGKLGDAITELERTLTIREEDGSPAVLSRAQIQNSVFWDLDALWAKEAARLTEGPDSLNFKAVQYLEERLALMPVTQPQTPRVLLELGKLYRYQEKIPEAVKTWEKALAARIPAVQGSKQWYWYHENVITQIQKWRDANMLSAALEIDREERAAKQSSRSGCFIATVCYGDMNHPDISAMRAWRDNVLTHWPGGRFAIAVYYTVSPIIARCLTRSPRLSACIRNFLIGPLAARVRLTHPKKSQIWT
jgi:TPR repeat protein